MRVDTILRIAALSVVLSAPLAFAPVAFASDANSQTEAKQQGMDSAYRSDQSRDPVYGITFPWTVLSDE